MTDNREGAAPMAVDAALVRQLAELLDETRLTEIEVQDGDRRIRVVRKPAPVIASAPAAAAPAALIAAAPGQPAAGLTPPTVDAADSTEGAIRSPMVGTVYLSAEPTARPFVSVGDTVSAGDTLLIVEAMKVMNPIVAPAGGTVTRVLVDNGQPVEFDQPLILVA